VTSDPAVSCGVADYTARLAAAMNKAGARAQVAQLPTWSFATAFALLEHHAEPGVLFHIQYPSLGMGASPAAALFPLLARRNTTFVTLHEFDVFNPLRKIFFVPFALTSDHVVFTNESEQRSYARFFPFARGCGATLPIGSNFEAPAALPQRRRLVYFGQIAPKKGLEEFLDAVKVLRTLGNDIPCAIIGAELDSHSDISRRIAADAEALGITLLYNLSAEDVSAELARASVALLPFPGGVGDKRGSALACLTLGLAVVTRHGPQTPQWWRGATHAMEDAATAAHVVAEIDAGRLMREPDAPTRARGLAEREWSAIARAHLSLYARALARRASGLEQRLA